MNPHSDPSPLQLSALQLAWLQEIGIEKPWLPAPAPGQAAKPATRALAGAGMPTTGEPEGAGRQPEDRQTTSPAGMPVNDLATSSVSTAVPAGRPAGLATGRPAGQPTNRGAKSTAKDEPEVVRGGAADTAKVAAAAQSLDVLAQGIAACQACGLCMHRERVVVGQGVMQAAVMVVGEAPGEQDDRQGEPFVGRPGTLLDNMLSAIGCGRDKNVYLANVVKCRPPSNRSPRPEEIEACRPFLLRQIELVKPLSILAVGKPAAQALLGVDATLPEMRGQAYTLPHPGHTVPVVVSYNPAYLLGKSAEKAATWKDLNQLKALIQAITGN